MLSSEGFTEVERQQDGNMELKNDNTKVDQVSNPPRNSRDSIPEIENSESSPQRPRVLGRSKGYRNRSCCDIAASHGVIPVDPGREAIARVRPRRKPTTKRRRSTRDHHANPLQSGTIGTVGTTVSVPNLPPRPPPAVPTETTQNAPSCTRTQATGTHAISQSSDILLVTKVAPCTNRERANTVSGIAGVPRSCSTEEATSAGRHTEHSMPESPDLGLLLQPAVGNSEGGCTPAPRKRRKKQGTRRQNEAKDRQDKNAPASSGRNFEGVAGINENLQDPIATSQAKTRTMRTPDSNLKAGSRKSSVLESTNDQANPVIGKSVSGSHAGYSKRRNKRMIRDVDENLSPQGKNIKDWGTMSNVGSTHGHAGPHRGRDYRRSSNNQSLPDATVLDFPSQRTSSVGSSRRRRGFQPGEVNKSKANLESEETSNTRGSNDVKNVTAMNNPSKVSATTNKLTTTMTPKATEFLAPHRRTQANDESSKHQSLIHSQAATIHESSRELNPVNSDSVSKPVESDTSSVQIITERKPSCWSIASPPEAPPTQWNSAAANIDRPATAKLPIYRFPKPVHNAERKTTVSFNRQQAKVNRQATGSTSEAQEPQEMNRPPGPPGSPRWATSGKDEVPAAANLVSREDGDAADSLHHQFQQLQHDERLDAKQASQVKAIQEEVLARTTQASSGAQLESDELKVSSHTQDTSQAKLLDVKGSNIAPSAVSSQVKTDKVCTSPGKQSRAAAPHLRVQSARSGSNNDKKTLPPHLRKTAGPTTPAEKAITHGEDVNTISAMLAYKIPPHLQGLSAAKSPVTVDRLEVPTPSPSSRKNDDSYRPTIDMDEEIAATQPVLDIDEEIIAGLRTETSDAFAVAQPIDSNVHETNEQVVFVPPQARASSSRVKASAVESKSRVNDKDAKSQADQHGDRNHSTNRRSNGYTAAPPAGVLQNVSSKRKNANLPSPSKNGAVPDGAESSVKKGKKPAREFESVDYTSELVDWDGKMHPPPVGDEWDRRRPFNPQSRERLSVIEAWREEHAADPEEKNRVIVDTANADFQTGDGLAGGDVNVLSPINKIDHETHTCNDEFTQARRDQNAAEAMKQYEAKLAAKPKVVPSGIESIIEGMTREEKRAYRRTLIEQDRTRVIPPNPHAPAANIYLRSAEFKDMRQVMNIYNHYVCQTSFVLHLDPVDELYWRTRLQEAEDERNPFIVAIHRGEKSRRKQGDIIRKKQEDVVGFAVAADFGSKNTMYHSSVELELMVHPDFYRQGIGRTLLDRILAALSPDYNILECAPFLPHNDICHWIGGGSRQAKAIMVNILYSDGQEDTVVAWRKQWLAQFEFQHVGTLPHVGFKSGKGSEKGKLVNMCQLVLNTSARL